MRAWLLFSPTTAITVLYGVMLACFFTYFAASICVFHGVIKALKARPYHEIRFARMNMNYQVRRSPNCRRPTTNPTLLTVDRFDSGCLSLSHLIRQP